MRNQDLSAKIGARLAECRKRAGLSQEVVAEYLGISSDAFSRMERGLIDIKVSRLIILSELYDVEPSRFLDDISNSEVLIDKRLCMLFDKLNKYDRKELVDIVGQLIDLMTK